MPELPEVETMRRTILPAVGQTITDVVICRNRLRPIAVQPRGARLRRRLVGRSIVAISRCGKRVVLELDDAHRLVFEPRMTGLVLPNQPPEQTHLRLVVWLSPPRTNLSAERERIARTVASICYWDQRGLGAVRLLSPAEFETLYGSMRIGPDALEISPDELQRRLGRSRREVKVALMDQRAVAGIGNIYASEILHRAGVHPAVQCSQLTENQWRAIASAARRVLREAIECGGSTLRDGTYRLAAEQEGGFQSRHLVYDRQGKPCLRCRKGEIVRIVQAQRSTYFCPVCQQ